MNLQNLTDEELAEHAVAVQTERERRDKLAQTPETVARLAQQYRDAGGLQEDLDAAVAS